MALRKKMDLILANSIINFYPLLGVLET